MEDRVSLALCVLGPLEVVRDGQPVRLGSAQQRRVLAALVVHANEVVSSDRLVDVLWGDDPPPSATHTLQTLLSRLRATLGDDRFETCAPGYRLRVASGELDALTFEELVRVGLGSADRPEVALRAFDEALELWRGSPYAEFASDEFAAPEVARLVELRARAIEERSAALLELSRPEEVLGALEAEIAAEPFRERLRALLMLALARAGRPVESLRVYDEFRRFLADEVGVVPSPGLQELNDDIVRQHPDVSWSGSPKKDAGTTALPSGTVTFLFTDLEGSTRLWEEHSEAMVGALARHDEIVRAAIASHDGQIVKSTGDGFHAVFVDAARAVDAAVDAQRRLSREVWGAPGELRVRMGLHSGAAEWRDGDYLGPTVNKAARVMGVGHGGQVLVSSATAELVSDGLRDEIGLVDLGAHRLRDLSRAERLFQACAPGLRETFPVLASLDALPNNLPEQLTSFIGRESEIAAVVKALETSRLVTLTGSAGCGKTRLALQIGAEVLRRFRDGVWLVELATLSDPALAVGAIASSLAVRQSTTGGMGLGGGSEPLSARPLEEIVVEHLRSRSALVMLDNCEHLLPACASFADRALRECPGLRILATSREPLGVDGEATRRVPSLSVPDAGQLPPGEQLADYEAVRLFLDRAALRAVDFAPTAGEMAAIAQICRRLDGIPLAIELAAARVRVLAPEDIAKRLDDQFLLLTGGRRTAVERHRTLRAAVDWSYNLLTEPEQVLLARLAVFAGSFSLEAAEAIGSDDTVVAEQVLDLIEHLVDRSLVDAEPNQTGVRYRLLESIRQYGRERLPSSGEADALRARHRDFFAELAARVQRGLWGPESGRWSDLVSADIDNIRAAIDWDLAGHNGVAALQIAVSLDAYWTQSQNFHEGLAWLDQCLAVAGDDASARLRARAQSAILVCARQVGELHRALQAGEAGLTLYRDLDDPRGLGMVLGSLALTARDLGRRADAQAYLAEALEVSRGSGFAPTLGAALYAKAVFALEHGDFQNARAACEEVQEHRDRYTPATIQWSLALLGAVALADGQYSTAVTWFEEAAQIQERATGSVVWGDPARGLAVTAVALGDLPRARHTYEEGLELARGIGASPMQEALCLAGLGEVGLYEGDLEQADVYHHRALELLEHSGRQNKVPQQLAAFARVALARGDADRAARLLGASDATREQLGVNIIAYEWPHPNETITATRKMLDDKAFSAAWAEGRAMPHDIAVTYALQTPSLPSQEA